MHLSQEETSSYLRTHKWRHQENKLTLHSARQPGKTHWHSHSWQTPYLECHYSLAKKRGTIHGRVCLQISVIHLPVIVGRVFVNYFDDERSHVHWPFAVSVAHANGVKHVLSSSVSVQWCHSDGLQLKCNNFWLCLHFISVNITAMRAKWIRLNFHG